MNSKLILSSVISFGLIVGLLAVIALKIPSGPLTVVIEDKTDGDTSFGGPTVFTNLLTRASSTISTHLNMAGSITVSGSSTFIGPSNFGKVDTVNIVNATTTLCSIGSATEDRLVYNVFSNVIAASTTDLTQLMVATSTNKTGAYIADTGSAFFNQTWPTTSASSSYLHSATTSEPLLRGVYETAIWPNGTFLNFYASSSIDFGGSGICGVEYVPLVSGT